MDAPLPDLTTWNCFACGQDHPGGLRLRFTSPGRERVRSEFVVSTDHTGLGPVVHGGIVATILDEAMAWALYRWRYRPHVTASMTLRFRGVIEAGVPLVAEAAITEDRGRRRTVAAVIRSAGADDRPLAESTGVYVPAPDTALETLSADQRGELDAVFAAFRSLDEPAG